MSNKYLEKIAAKLPPEYKALTKRLINAGEESLKQTVSGPNKKTAVGSLKMQGAVNRVFAKVRRKDGGPMNRALAIGHRVFAGKAETLTKVLKK